MLSCDTQLRASTVNKRELSWDTNLEAAGARRHEPKAGAALGTPPPQAVRLRTAGKQSQRFETALRDSALKRKPTGQTQELTQCRNPTPARAGNERDAKHRTANHDGATTNNHREALVREPHRLAGRQRTDGPPEQWRRTRACSMPPHANVRAA